MIAGSTTTSRRPASAMAMNQTTITGPNAPPTALVPNRCTANSTASTAIVIGTTTSLRLGETTSTPSTADSTEIAGVMTPSP